MHSDQQVLRYPLCSRNKNASALYQHILEHLEGIKRLHGLKKSHIKVQYNCVLSSIFLISVLSPILDLVLYSASLNEHSHGRQGK